MYLCNTRVWYRPQIARAVEVKRRKTLLQRVTETIEKKKAKRRRRGKEQNVKWKGSEKDSILCHICNSAGFCFIFSKHVPLRTRASNSATTESLSCWRLISYFHLLKAINTHRESGRWEMHNNRGWLFRINATTAFPVFFYFSSFSRSRPRNRNSLRLLTELWIILYAWNDRCEQSLKHEGHRSCQPRQRHITTERRPQGLK